MRLIRSTLAIILSLWMMAPVSAQQATVADRAVIDRALADHTQQTESDREAIRRVLQRQEVRNLAERAKIDLRRVRSAIATLDARELADVAAHARKVDRALEGGASTVTISTTMIIIGLLVLILLIVALD